jgi:hypothetical protein
MVCYEYILGYFLRLDAAGNEGVFKINRFGILQWD